MSERQPDNINFRNAGIYHVFMDDFRKQFKEENPDNKSVSIVCKAGGEKWKSVSDTDKAPYSATTEKFKAQYLKKLTAYEKGEFKNDEEDSEKSKSEVNDGESEEGGTRY